MFDAIGRCHNNLGRHVLDNTDDLYALLLGKCDSRYDETLNWEIRCVTARYAYQMYNCFIKERDGVG